FGGDPLSSRRDFRHHPGPADVGTDTLSARPRPLPRQRQRPGARRPPLASRPARLLVSRARAHEGVSRHLPRPPAARLRSRRAAPHRIPRPSRRARYLRDLDHRATPPRLGRVRQIAVRRPAAGAGLPRPLIPIAPPSPTTAWSPLTVTAFASAGAMTPIAIA